ncbi:Cadmium, zinc and cobalt-transporting ATPase [Dirofilaria immitis]
MEKQIQSKKSINDIISNDSMISLNTIIWCFTLLNSVKLIIIIGLIFTLAISIYIIMCFRPAILAIIVPITVITTTLYGVLRRKHSYLWPIIGISKNNQTGIVSQMIR